MRRRYLVADTDLYQMMVALGLRSASISQVETIIRSAWPEFSWQALRAPGAFPVWIDRAKKIRN